MFEEIYKNKNVLVTGHSGFKGSWLCKWLTILGANVSGYSLELEVEDHFSKLSLAGNYQTGDINNFSELSSFFKKENPEIIFHLAAQPLVRESYSTPLETFQTNVMGTANVLEACKGLPDLKAVVIITTDKCYENKEWHWGYRENEAMGGYDPYSASKGCAELVTSSYRRSFFSLETYEDKHQVLIASARAGNVIGGGDWSTDRLIPDLVKTVSNGSKVEIRSPKATRPWQHVLECLSGYLLLGQKLLQQEPSYAEAWNFGPNHNGSASVETVVSKAYENWKEIRFALGKNDSGLHEAQMLKLDCSKANQKLKWQPIWDMNETISKTINWYKDYYQENKCNTTQDIEDYIEAAKEANSTWIK